MSTASILTVLAIFLGPIAAVIITRIIDNKRSADHRKMDIFRTLMRTRRQPTSIQHVEALNLIEIEFSGCNRVIDSFSKLFEHFDTQHARLSTEEVGDGMDQSEASHRNILFDTRIANERQKLLAKLLHAIATERKIKIEQLEILEGGYAPQVWANIELEQTIIRKYMTDLYQGRGHIPVYVVNDPPASDRNHQDSI